MFRISIIDRSNRSTRKRSDLATLTCAGVLLFAAASCLPAEFDSMEDDELGDEIAEQATGETSQEVATIPGEAPMPTPQQYERITTVAGDNWQLDEVSGTLFEGGAASRENVYVVRERSGIESAPLPSSIKLELQADTTSTTTDDEVFIVSRDVADAIAQAELTGQSNALIEQYGDYVLEPGPIDGPDPGDGPSPIEEPYLEANGKSGSKDPQEVGVLACNDRTKTKTKTFNLNLSTNRNYNIGGGFSGSLGADVGVTGTATTVIRYKAKRKRVLFFCVTYGFKFLDARMYGNVQAEADASISGTLSYNYHWETEIAKPHLGSLTFWVGPVPVYIGFKLPIDLGLDLNASVTGTVGYNGSSTATGTFDYTCSLSSCAGNGNYNLGNSTTPAQITGSVSGRVKPDVWAQASVRAYLYNEWLAYAQVGIKPMLRGDLWGYYGNTCGDADDNGINETVDALTFDLDWQVYITARARAFGGNPKKWNDLWHSSRRHIRFWDLIGSDALRPMLDGPASVNAGNNTLYKAKMRPCWPYNDSVSYRINWGDGSSQSSFSATAHNWTNRYHTFNSSGAKTVSTTALSDSHGRSFNKTSSRTVNVNGSSNPTWTGWLDRDNASGSGDWETLNLLAADGLTCSNPVGIQCQTTSGVDWTSAGEVYTCSVSSGGICRNADQSDGYCQDYRVRFLCP